MSPASGARAVGDSTATPASDSSESASTSSAYVDGKAKGDAATGAQAKSISSAPVSDDGKAQAKGNAEEDSERADSAQVDMSDNGSAGGEAPMRKAGFAELFRYATKWDLLFNFAGLLAACAAGAAQVRVEMAGTSSGN